MLTDEGIVRSAKRFQRYDGEMGSNSVQGTQMDMGGKGFFSSIGSSLFTSTSKSIANLIKANKAKLKYNSYVFLIDEKQLKDSQNQQKKIKK